MAVQQTRNPFSGINNFSGFKSNANGAFLAFALGIILLLIGSWIIGIILMYAGFSIFTRSAKFVVRPQQNVSMYADEQDGFEDTAAIQPPSFATPGTY